MGMSPYKMVYGKACYLPLELAHKAYWAIKELNYDFKLAGEKRLFDISSLDEWRKMPSYLKRKLKDGMINESKSVSSKLENMFFCTTLVSDSLEENFSLNEKAHILSRKFIVLEQLRSIMTKAQIRRWSTGK